MARLRLALAQPPAHLGSPLDWLRDELPAIAATGAELLLLPELFACGYNIGAALRDRAEPVDGPTRQALADLARTHDIAILCGFAERAAGRLYNAALCVGPGGALLCHQRKLTTPPGFEGDYFTRGESLQPFTYKGFRIATMICYDAEFPETVRHVAQRGVQLVLVPTALGADWGWVARTMIPTRAYENGLYLAYANSAGTQGDMAFLGASCIVAPDGTEAARAGADPTILTADLDTARVETAQTSLPNLRDRPRLNPS